MLLQTPPLTCLFCELLAWHLLCCPPLRCTAFGHPNVPEFGRPNVHHVSLGVLQENYFTVTNPIFITLEFQRFIFLIICGFFICVQFAEAPIY